MDPDTLHRTDLESALLIGEASIDKEHQALLRQLEILMESDQTSPDTEGHSELLSQLGREITEHFSHEEALCKALGMPAAEAERHQQAHTRIVEQYVQLNLDLMRGIIPDHQQVAHLVGEWIVGHILQYDLDIRRYLPAQH